MIVILIIGILAALVVPRFSNASDIAQSVSLKDNLRMLRVQIQVYSAQHNSIAPGYPGGNENTTPTETDFINQMTKYTSSGGIVGGTHSDTYPYGPYVREIPLNPINGLRTILVLGNASPMPTAPSDSTSYGWIFKPYTRELRPYILGQDQDGIKYYDY